MKLALSRRGIRVCFADTFYASLSFVAALIVFGAVLRPAGAVVAPVVGVALRPLLKLKTLHGLVALRPPAPGAALALRAAALAMANVLARGSRVGLEPTPAELALLLVSHNGSSSCALPRHRKRLSYPAWPSNKNSMCVGLLRRRRGGERYAAAQVGNQKPPGIGELPGAALTSMPSAPKFIVQNPSKILPLGNLCKVASP